jgi:membrane fusion protein
VRNPLFRSEVYEAEATDHLGVVHLPRTRLATVALVLSLALLIMLGAFLFFARYSKKIAIPGRLVPVQGISSLYAPTSGVVVKWMVKEGEPVSAGQALVEISPETFIASDSVDARSINQQLTEQIDIRKRMLVEKLSVLDTEQEQRRGSLSRRAAHLKGQLLSADSELDIRKAQHDAARDMLARVNSLRSQGSISEIQMQQYRNDALAAQAAAELSQRTRLEIAYQLADARQELEQNTSQFVARRSEILGDIAAAEQDVIRIRANARVVIKASRAGVVTGIAFTEGEFVQTQSRIVSIVPADKRLIAELWAPSSALSTISLGDAIRIRYDAFPFQLQGQQAGRVVEIARAPLMPDEIRRRTGALTEAPAYRVVVALEAHDLPDGLKAVELRAGMRLDAHVAQNSRPIYEWLFEPLRKPMSAAEGHPPK